MPRGRPTQSVVRQNIIEILHYIGQGYGYDIAKIYNEIFPSAHQRTIYYHLRKGVQTEELTVHEIREEKGDYSWGSVVEKIYYTLGPQAEPKGEERVEAYLQKRGEVPSTSKNAFTKFVGKFRKEK